MDGPAPPILQVGGAVNATQAVYIIRQTDAEVFGLLARCEYCNVICSRQMGKTSLLFRTKARLSAIGTRTASIDVGGVLGDVPPEQADRWFCSLLEEIAEQTSLECDVDLWWASHGSATRNRRLILFFKEVVFSRDSAPVVVFLDEIDSTLSLPYADDLFLAMRAMYNDRAEDPMFRRLAFCLLGVVSPGELIKARHATPYNVGQTVELHDFDPDLDDLRSLYRAVAPTDEEAGEQLVREVMCSSGGHPYLTLQLCYLSVQKDLQARGSVVDLVSETFSTFDAAKSDSNIESVATFFKRAPAARQALDLYRRIVRGKQERDRTTPAHFTLRLSGLVKRDRDGFLQVRNAIYKRVFTDDWARAMIPPWERAVRNARLFGVAAGAALTVVILIIYLVAYPARLASRLESAVAEDRYSVDVYELLSNVPFRKGTADEIWARLHGRRAVAEAARENRDEALLWSLKGLTLRPDDTKLRGLAAQLLNKDYPRLRTTMRLGIPKEQSPATTLAKALSADGRFLAFGGRDGVVRVWDLSQPSLRPRAFGFVGELAAPRRVRRITSLALSPHGTRLAAGGEDGIASVWHLTRIEDMPLSLHSHTTAVDCLAFSPDESRLASGDSEGNVRVWNLQGPSSPELSIKPVEGMTHCMAFSPDGSLLAIGDSEGAVVVWDRSDSASKHVRRWKIDDMIYSLAFSPDQQNLAEGGEDGVLRVWQLNAPQAAPIVLQGQASHCYALAFGQDSRLLVSGTDDGAARVWDVYRPSAQPVTLHGHSRAVYVVGFNREGQLLTGDAGGIVRVWDQMIPDSDASHDLVLRSNTPIATVARSPVAQLLACGDRSGVVQVWDLSQPHEPPLAFRDLKSGVRSLTFSRLGDQLAASDSSGSIAVWQPGRPSKESAVVAIAGCAITALAFDHTGDRLVSGDSEGALGLWQLSKHALLGQTKPVDSPIFAVAINADGRSASGNADGGVQMRPADLTSTSPISLPGTEVMIHALTFTDDGRWLAAGDSDGAVRLWDLTRTNATPVELPGQRGPVSSMTFSTEADALLVATRWWVHLEPLTNASSSPRNSWLLPSMVPPSSPDAFQFGRRSSDGHQGAAMPTANLIQPVTFFWPTASTELVSGDASRLLDEWSRRLGLMIQADGSIRTRQIDNADGAQAN
jgi:WD40 repeat protein